MFQYYISVTKFFLANMCTYDKIPYVKILAYDSNNIIRMIRMLELWAGGSGFWLLSSRNVITSGQVEQVHWKIIQCYFVRPWCIIFRWISFWVPLVPNSVTCSKVFVYILLYLNQVYTVIINKQTINNDFSKVF